VCTRVGVVNMTEATMTTLEYLSVIESVEEGSLLLWGASEEFPEVKHQPTSFVGSVRYLWKRMGAPNFGLKLQFLIHDVVALGREEEDVADMLPGFVSALKRLSVTYRSHPEIQQLLHAGISDCIGIRDDF